MSTELAVMSRFLAVENYRENIQAIEQFLTTLPQAELVARHHFAHGTYTRELDAPVDSFVTGIIHKNSCINLLIKGKVALISDEGFAELTAPHVYVSGDDVKKAILVLEDCTWVNVFPWDGQMTVDEIMQNATLEGALCLAL